MAGSGRENSLYENRHRSDLNINLQKNNTHTFLDHSPKCNKNLFGSVNLNNNKETIVSCMKITDVQTILMGEQTAKRLNSAHTETSTHTKRPLIDSAEKKIKEATQIPSNPELNSKEVFNMLFKGSIDQGTIKENGDHKALADYILFKEFMKTNPKHDMVKELIKFAIDIRQKDPYGDSCRIDIGDFY